MAVSQVVVVVVVHRSWVVVLAIDIYSNHMIELFVYFLIVLDSCMILAFPPVETLVSTLISMCPMPQPLTTTNETRGHDPQTCRQCVHIYGVVHKQGSVEETHS